MTAVFLMLLIPFIDNSYFADPSTVKKYEAAHPQENLAEETESGREVLPKEVKKSLVFRE